VNKRQAAAQFKRKHIYGSAYTLKEAEQYLETWSLFDGDGCGWNRYVEISQFESKSGNPELIEWSGRSQKGLVL